MTTKIYKNKKDNDNYDLLMKEDKSILVRTLINLGKDISELRKQVEEISSKI